MFGGGVSEIGTSVQQCSVGLSVCLSEAVPELARRLNLNNLQILQITTMLARTFRAPRALARPRASLRRAVTTDAASSHAEKENVPSADDEPFQVKLSDESFETYDLPETPPYKLDTTKSELKRMYYDMVCIRRMEMAADRLYKEKKIRGFCHLSTGQEAVAAGIEHAISKEDSVITAYRCHGFALMRGGTVKSIIGELLGRRGGIAFGKGGSMHMASPETCFNHLVYSRLTC